ncbi:MAG: fimbrillin family protein [Alistipes sp.]|nr:fimbrillin family protein [Alistipes sp.]
MKKLFVALLAVAGLTACFNEEVVRVQDPTAISFEANWVENATRADVAVDPSTTTESLKGFKVWGFMDNVEGKVFEGEEVTGSQGNFTYNNLAYWLPGHTYYFAALAPIGGNWTLNTEAANKLGAGVVSFENENGTEDLLYAANVEEAPALGEAKTVKFTFSHLLSKVKFTFTNGFTNENMYIDVKNVRIVNAPAAGSIDLAVENWWDNDDWALCANADGEETVELAFGDACAKTPWKQTQVAANERLTIPASAEYKYNVVFDVALYVGGVEAYKGTKTSYVQGVALEMGKAYNFSATLNASNFTEQGVELMPIVFDVVEVKEWVEADDVATVLPSNISGLTLVADAVAKNTLNLKGSFDGAGHTLFAEAVEVKGGAARLIDATADSQVRNLNIDGGNLVVNDYGIRALFLNGAGEFVIDNVTIDNVTYTLNDDAAAKTIKVVNSTFKGWTSYNKSTTATFENVTFAQGKTEYNTIRPHGTTTFKNCTFEGTTILLDKLAADNTVKFQNCTYNGRALTSADLTSAPAGAVEVKYVVTEAPKSNALVSTSASNMTIDGGNFRTEDGKGLRAIYLNGVTGEFTFDNIVAKNVAYAINVNSTKAVTLNVSNSTLQGWTSYGASTTATFTNVNFTCGNYYANNEFSSNDNGLFRPYGETVCKGCSFENGFYIDLGSLSGKLTLKNCTYNGTVLTAENVATVAKFDNFDASKLAF